jgi:hypothetical protein
MASHQTPERRGGGGRLVSGGRGHIVSPLLIGVPDHHAWVQAHGDPEAGYCILGWGSPLVAAGKTCRDFRERLVAP